MSEFKFPAEYLKSRRSAAHMNVPGRPTRAGVPDGWSREYYALATPHDKIAEIMSQLEGAGIIAVGPLPDTDDAIAKATLKEAVTIALHPAVPLKDKLVAINTCLAYTKTKPVTRAELNVKKPEDWLSEAIEASKHEPE